MPLCFKCRMKGEYRVDGEDPPLKEKRESASRDLRVGEICDLCGGTIIPGIPPVYSFEFATPLLAGRGWRCNIDESRCEAPYCDECEKAMKWIKRPRKQ